MIPDVWNNLYETYWDILSGERIPLDYGYYMWRVNMWADMMGFELDWETQRMYAQEEAAYDYLRSHVICLLSKPDEYMQHMKAGDLWAFVKGPCKYTPSRSWTETIKSWSKELKEYIQSIYKKKNK